MTPTERDLLVWRIVSGTVRLRVGGRTYLLRNPTPDQRYAAALAYREELPGLLAEGLLSDDDLLAYLYAEGFWDDGREQALADCKRDLDDFKVRLFHAGFRSGEMRALRQAVGRCKEKISLLYAQRHAMDHQGATGTALAAQARYLVGCGLFTASGQRVFPDDRSYWDDDGTLVEEALEAYQAERIGEEGFRELARTDPWRGVWQARKAGDLFGVPATQLSDEQRSLVSYTLLYDSVYECPDCPPDDVIEDDDRLDGWLIEQRRKRDGRVNRAAAEQLSQGVRDKDEVFLVADTAEDARKVMGLNDDRGRAVQKTRFAHLRQKGVVSELDMPDTRRRLRMEAVKKIQGGT